jgi:hypothetical protein
MAIIKIHVGKNMVDDILLDGSSRVNAIIDGLRRKLGLLLPQPTPFNLMMVDFSYNKPLGIPYIVTFTFMNNKVVNPTYSMLLGCPWLRDTKVIHDYDINM